MTAPATFGRIVRSIGIDDVLLLETIHQAGAELPPHDHAHATITLTIAGGFTESFAKGAVASGAGTVVLKPAGERHADRYHRDRDTHCLTVVFGARAAARIGAASKVLERRAAWPGGPVSRAMRDLARELALRDGASLMLAESCIWRVLGLAERDQAAPHRGARPPWLAIVEDFIRENADRRLSLGELAALAGIHPGHLSRVFRRHLGSSAGAYQRRLQLERARRRLLGSTDPIARIAAEAGFADQSHFTRSFRAETGATPARYRREARAGGSSR